MLGHAYLGAFHTRTYGAIAKRIVTILVLHSVLPIILYSRIGMDSFDRGFVGAGIAGLQPLNGLGENLTAPLYCCVRETPRRSEEALCSCSTRLQQDVSLGWKRRLLCGRPLPGSAEIHCPVPLCHSGDEFQQNTWIAKSLEKQLAVMPCLHGSTDGFFVSLAKAVEPRLLIAGQEIFLSSNKDRIIRGPTVQLMWMSGSLNVCTIFYYIVQYVYINMS